MPYAAQPNLNMCLSYEYLAIHRQYVLQTVRSIAIRHVQDLHMHNASSNTRNDRGMNILFDP